jgi:hypothetical protein
VAGGEWDEVRLLLHPYLHWTDGEGRTTRGRTKVLQVLADRPPIGAPVSYELRDDQVYRWTEPPSGEPKRGRAVSFPVG